MSVGEDRAGEAAVRAQPQLQWLLAEGLLAVPGVSPSTLQLEALPYLVLGPRPRKCSLYLECGLTL